MLLDENQVYKKNLLLKKIFDRKNINDLNLFFYRKVKKMKLFKNNLNKIKKNKLIRLKKILNNRQKKIIIFCAGSYSEIIIKISKKLGFKISFILDNNKYFEGQRISNISIKHPSFIENKINYFSNYQILICNKNFNDFKIINKQLKRIGFENNNIKHINI